MPRGLFLYVLLPSSQIAHHALFLRGGVRDANEAEVCIRGGGFERCSSSPKRALERLRGRSVHGRSITKSNPRSIAGLGRARQGCSLGKFLCMLWVHVCTGGPLMTYFDEWAIRAHAGLNGSLGRNAIRAHAGSNGPSGHTLGRMGHPGTRWVEWAIRAHTGSK